MQALAFVSIHFALGAVLAFVANWVGLISWRRAAAAHWTERARLLWPARVGAVMNIIVIPALLNEVHRFIRLDIHPHYSVTILAGVVGVLFGTYRFDHELFPELHFREWLYQTATSGGIRACVWGVLFGAVALMPDNVGWGTLAVTVVYLTFHFAFQRGLGLKLLKLVKFIGPASERLATIVEQTSARCGVRPKEVMESGGVWAQAYAYPVIGKLLFTRRLLEVCSDEDVSAICAHELAHLSESKWVLAGRMLGSLMFFPLIFINPVATHTTYGILLLLCAPSVIHIFSNKLSRRMEKRADSAALEHAVNEGVYANALEKIYRVNQLPAVTPGNRQTHPHLYDRMLAAKITASYPRPLPPQRMNTMIWLYAALIVTFLILDVIYSG